jgi:type IV fimbrial biogenesis protein FimT
LNVFGNFADRDAGVASAGCAPTETLEDPGMGTQILRRERGFSVLELMVVVAVAAVLATIAVPSFARMKRAASLSAATNQLLWALNFARSAAILDSAPVTLCLSADGESCLKSAAATAVGWLVFYESRGPATLPVLHAFRLPEDVSVHGTRAAVTFWPVARAGTTSTFDLCGVRGRGVQPGRAVVVSQTGRSRVATEEAACAP